MKVVNVVNLLATSTMGEFVDVLPFNNTLIGAVDISGASPFWEIHPDTDELFYVISGRLELELLIDSGSEHHSASANEIMVAPKGFWHKLSAPDSAKFIYLTPGQSLHSGKADPRV